MTARVTATVTSVSDSATSITLAAANNNRKGISIVNTSDAILKLKCGSPASAISYTEELSKRDSWECPVKEYVGIVTGIWESDTVSGAALVTEYSARSS